MVYKLISYKDSWEIYFTMRKLIVALFLGVALVMTNSAFALLSMELTRGVAGAVPIAIAPFAVNGQTPSQDVSAVIANDLKNSGRFKVSGGNAVSENMPISYYRSIGADSVVMGKVQDVGG